MAVAAVNQWLISPVEGTCFMTIQRKLLAFAALTGSPSSLFAGIDSFVGQWVGQGPTKVEIRLVDNQLRLHAFGACRPQDCDWGEVAAQAYAPNVSANVRDSAEAVSAQFETSFSRTLVILYPNDADGLRVEIFTVFLDNSRRSPYHKTVLMRRAI
jgi:hypothetical protein